MKKSKKLIAIFCVICLSINLLLVHASDDLHMDTELLELSNRIPILTLDIGSENGEVGYGGSEQFGYTGPDSFVVENGVVYVLDALNSRINVYQGEASYEIMLDKYSSAEKIEYKDGKLAVVDNRGKVTLIYTLLGNLVEVVAHPEVVIDELVSKVVEIGENHIIWRTFQGNYYRYEWSDEITMVEQPEVELLEGYSNSVVSFKVDEKLCLEWQIETENRFIDVLGVYGGALVYQQYEYATNVDMLFAELSVRKLNQDGRETYAIIDFSEWKAPARDPFYLSSDGIVYVMECREENTVISEVLLGTTDESKMEMVQQRAEARRLEVKQQERASVNQTEAPAHIESRMDVLSRVELMMNEPWTVLPTHKDKRAGYESVITIPNYILAAGDYTSVVGIPYCWGGYHGLAGERYEYDSFDSVYELTDKTAGNIYTETPSLVPGTIGLDCVGFVMSAYDMAGEKLHSSAFVNMALPVNDFEDLKLMDILARNGHVMMYGGMDGANVITYETYTNDSGSEGGKTDVYVRQSLADLVGKYVGRNLFCETCDKAGSIAWIRPSGHVHSCSECEYEWPEEQHNIELVADNLTHSQICSVCGYIAQSGAHNTNGTMTADNRTHTYVCSVCNIGWKTEGHDNVTITPGTANKVRYTCLTCNHSWIGVNISNGIELEAHNISVWDE